LVDAGLFVSLERGSRFLIFCFQDSRSTHPALFSTSVVSSDSFCKDMGSLSSRRFSGNIELYMSKQAMKKAPGPTITRERTPSVPPVWDLCAVLAKSRPMTQAIEKQAKVIASLACNIEGLVPAKRTYMAAPREQITTKAHKANAHLAEMR
jgi:hypothetical protein